MMLVDRVATKSMDSRGGGGGGGKIAHVLLPCHPTVECFAFSNETKKIERAHV